VNDKRMNARLELRGIESKSVIDSDSNPLLWLWWDSMLGIKSCIALPIGLQSIQSKHIHHYCIAYV
jgi:hypothetical protein